jgi:hypothetical protein
MDARKGLFRRVLDGMIAARQRSAERTIETYLEMHPERRRQDQIGRK